MNAEIVLGVVMFTAVVLVLVAVILQLVQNWLVP